MLLKYGSVVALVALTLSHSPAHAFFGDLLKGINNLANCQAWTDSPEDQALAHYDRMSTPLPAGTFRKVVPFKESDFQTKPWMRQYEYVVVVNNSSPYVHRTDFPAQHPIPYSAKELGLTEDSGYDQKLSSLRFLEVYGEAARKVYYFGTLERVKNPTTGKMEPVKSNLPGAQTIRIYQRGQLIRVGKVSTGRGGFELRDKNPRCTKRPNTSYYSVTESGYYNFQELIKTGYQSGEWDGADMPNAMFYLRGRGLALHEAAAAKIPKLGTRDSGGCTRLDPNTASSLFDSIAATKGATIPVLDVYGNPVLDAAGRIQYKNQEEIIWGEGTRNEKRVPVASYSALLIIQPSHVVDASPARDQQVTYQYRKESDRVYQPGNSELLY